MLYNLNDHLCVDVSQIYASRPDICSPFFIIFSFLVDTFQIDAPVLPVLLYLLLK